MTTTFVETDCTITHDGRTFESGGAYRTGNRIAVYTSLDGTVTTWHGERLGTYRVISEWRVYSRWQGRTMRSIRVTLDDGTQWTGRQGDADLLFARRIKG